MKATLLNQTAMLSLVVAVLLLASGCGQQTSEPIAGSTQIAESHDDPSHSGWWCVEHGVPEEECSMCSSKAADEFKTKGDWCEEHNRAESQCFICHPELAKKFSKLYEAKVGHAPPKPESE